MFEQTTERVAFNKKLKLSEKLKKKKKNPNSATVYQNTGHLILVAVARSKFWCSN